MIYFFYGYAGNTDFFYSYVGFFYARFGLAALPLSEEPVFLIYGYAGFHTSAGHSDRHFKLTPSEPR